MKYQILINEVSVSELKDMITDAVSVEMKRCQSKPEPTKSILTRKETATLLGISLPTLHFWTKDGKIKGTRIGTRVRYRIEDIEAAMVKIDTMKYKKA